MFNQFPQKNASKESEYVEDAIHDSTLKALVKNIYRVFRLLHGPVRRYLKKYGKEKLVRSLYFRGLN